MAKEFIVSPYAQEDLDAVWEYYAERNLEEVGNKLIAEITNRFFLLLQYPEIGRERNELLLYLRSFAVKEYVILYQPTDYGIEILRVIKGSRNIPKLFDEMIGE